MPKAQVVQAPVHRRTYSDPLSAALLPPLDETPFEREARLKAESDAKKISDSIDDMLHQERNQRKKTKPEVNVLLLGQSESGKSTTLKQFQLLHSPSAFHAERIAWRAVIYLNLVRSIRRILDALAPEADALDDHDDGDSLLETASVIITSNGRPASAILGTRVANYEVYRRRLEPLVELEERLIRLLSVPEEDEPSQADPAKQVWQQYAKVYNNESLAPPLKIHSPTSPNGRPSPSISIPQRKPTMSSLSGSTASSYHSSYSIYSMDSTANEIAVHTSMDWKKPFKFGTKSKSPKSAHTGEIEGWWVDPQDPVHTLNACAPAMQELWRDPQVRKCLDEKRLRLEESSGFYLDEIPRITAKKYIPIDADVLKARLKTMGVFEYTFSISSGTNRGVQWRIYDVGGARNQRQAWAPYFEDVNAIIFLAPISAFDQVLAEDSRVNRLEDSLILWKSVVSNKLLKNVSIVLFLNKCDLLRAKLEAGVRLNHHLVSYGDRPNDYDSVSKYFRNKFGVIHQAYTPNRERELYIHLTSVTDTRRTHTIILTVRDIIIKRNLRTLSLV